MWKPIGSEVCTVKDPKGFVLESLESVLDEEERKKLKFQSKHLIDIVHGLELDIVNEEGVSLEALASWSHLRLTKAPNSPMFLDYRKTLTLSERLNLDVSGHIRIYSEVFEFVWEIQFATYFRFLRLLEDLFLSRSPVVCRQGRYDKKFSSITFLSRMDNYHLLILILGEFSALFPDQIDFCYYDSVSSFEKSDSSASSRPALEGRSVGNSSESLARYYSYTNDTSL